MKNKIILVVKFILLATLSLLWFVLIQGEYEMVTKPYLQNDFPVIKGIGAVYFLGAVLFIIGVLIIILLHPILKKIKFRKG